MAWWRRPRAIDRATRTRLLPTTHLGPAADVHAATEEGRTVLLDMKRERYMGLDEVGTTMWALLERGTRLPEIVEVVSAAYDAPTDQIEADARRFVAELVDLGLVVLS